MASRKRTKKTAKQSSQKEMGEMLSYIVENMATKEDVADIRREMATKVDLRESEERVSAKVERVDSKFGAFENNEVDKRKQLEVRVTRIEEKIAA